MSHYHFTRYCT